jgi:hypothetical protein
MTLSWPLYSLGPRPPLLTRQPSGNEFASSGIIANRTVTTANAFSAGMRTKRQHFRKSLKLVGWTKTLGSGRSKARPPIQYRNVRISICSGRDLRCCRNRLREQRLVPQLLQRIKVRVRPSALARVAARLLSRPVQAMRTPTAGRICCVTTKRCSFTAS